MFTKALVSAALLAAFVAPLAADAGEVHNRINREQSRINQGVRNDSLTYGEYHRLDNGLDRIQAERNRDLRRNGGHLTPAEVRQLNRQQNRLSDRIYYDKHNDDRAH